MGVNSGRPPIDNKNLIYHKFEAGLYSLILRSKLDKNEAHL